MSTTESKDPGALALARVAHETAQAYRNAVGDFAAHLAWELLTPQQQDTAYARAFFFLNNPDAKFTAVHNALELADDKERAAAAIFHGVIRAICREQARA